jgi:hypothetical protein
MQPNAGRKKSPGWRGIFARFTAAFRWESNELEKERNPGLLETLELACREWKYARLYFNCVTDPDLIDHAVFYIGATEKKYMYLLKRAREEGLNIDNFRLS